VRGDSPVALVVADLASVKGVIATFLVLGDVIFFSIDGESTVFDAVGWVG
jgi:hypothetical protein